MKDMTTLLGKYFTNSKTGAVCAITAVDEENRRVTANIDGELKEQALGTLTGGWRKASDEEIETVALTAVEIPATNNGGSGPSYEAEPIPARNVEPEAQDAPEQTPELHGEPEPTETANNEPETAEPTTDDQDKPQQTMQMSDVVTKLENLFDLLNKAYFEGKLERPVITVQSTPKAYGHCSTKKIWQADGNGMYEINIGAEFLNRSSEQTAATMCHEMVHLYCGANEIQETCQKGRYHNKTFKLEAEARDLAIEYDRANGYTHTTPTDAFIKTLTDNGFTLEVPFARQTLEKSKAKADREKAHKYVCPVCGQEVRTTAELSLICGVCEVSMERED